MDSQRLIVNRYDQDNCLFHKLRGKKELIISAPFVVDKPFTNRKLPLDKIIIRSVINDRLIIDHLCRVINWSPDLTDFRLLSDCPLRASFYFKIIESLLRYSTLLTKVSLSINHADPQRSRETEDLINYLAQLASRIKRFKLRTVSIGWYYNFDLDLLSGLIKENPDLYHLDITIHENLMDHNRELFFRLVSQLSIKKLILRSVMVDDINRIVELLSQRDRPRTIVLYPIYSLDDQVIEGYYLQRIAGPPWCPDVLIYRQIGPRSLTQILRTVITSHRINYSHLPPGIIKMSGLKNSRW